MLLYHSKLFTKRVQFTNASKAEINGVFFQSGLRSEKIFNLSKKVDLGAFDVNCYISGLILQNE